MALSDQWAGAGGATRTSNGGRHDQLPAPQGPIETDDDEPPSPVPSPMRRRGPAGPERPPECWSCACTGSTTPPRPPCSTCPRTGDTRRATSSDRSGCRPGAGRRAAGPARVTCPPASAARPTHGAGWCAPSRTSAGSGGGAVAGVSRQSLLCADPAVPLGNAAQWTRRLTQAGDRPGRQVWTAVASGLSRLFGFVLTLLFTTTAATLALDIGALSALRSRRCAAAWRRCSSRWSSGAPASASPCWPCCRPPRPWRCGCSRRCLGCATTSCPGCCGRLRGARPTARRPPTTRAAPAADRAARRDAAVLSSPGFWSNRMIRHLARAHLAAALL